VTFWARIKPYLLLGLVALAGLLAFVLTFGRSLASLFAKKQLPPDQPSEKQKKIEQDAAEKERELYDETEKKVVEIQDAHDGAVKDVVEAQEERYQELKDDPEALNDWLLKVGKDVRGK